MKLAILLSGDQVLHTQAVPDNTTIVWHNLGSEPLPQPAPTATLPEFLEQTSPAAVDHQDPEPNSRNGLAWRDWEIELAKSDRSDAEVAKRVGRNSASVRNYRQQRLGWPSAYQNKRWTEEEVDMLMELAGPKPLASDAAYQQFAEFFPRHPSTSGLKSKHERVIYERFIQTTDNHNA